MTLISSLISPNSLRRKGCSFQKLLVAMFSEWTMIGFLRNLLTGVPFSLYFTISSTWIMLNKIQVYKLYKRMKIREHADKMQIWSLENQKHFSENNQNSWCYRQVICGSQTRVVRIQASICPKLPNAVHDQRVNKWERLTRIFTILVLR